MDDSAVHAELARRKDAGTLIGLTLSSPNQADVLERALALRVDGVPLFDAVQSTWNMLEPSAGPRLEAAHRAGLAVIIKEALANGRLTTRNDASDFADRRRVLEDLADRFNTSLDALALAVALARPWVSVVLSGAATEAQLQSNLRACAVHWDAEAESVIETLAEEPDAYWGTRSRLAWN